MTHGHALLLLSSRSDHGFVRLVEAWSPLPLSCIDRFEQGLDHDARIVFGTYETGDLCQTVDRVFSALREMQECPSILGVEWQSGATAIVTLSCTAEAIVAVADAIDDSVTNVTALDGSVTKMRGQATGGTPTAPSYDVPPSAAVQ